MDLELSLGMQPCTEDGVYKILSMLQHPQVANDCKQHWLDENRRRWFIDAMYDLLSRWDSPHTLSHIEQLPKTKLLNIPKWTATKVKSMVLADKWMKVYRAPRTTEEYLAYLPRMESASLDSLEREFAGSAYSICPICIEPLKDGELVIQGECRHNQHAQCIQKFWLKSNGGICKEDHTCVICRCSSNKRKRT